MAKDPFRSSPDAAQPASLADRLRGVQNGLDAMFSIAQIGGVVGPSTPATSSAPGVQGALLWDASYIYVCTSPNTWKRATLVAF
jgi:hypothetical protein